jgi:hypothetical protein
MIEDKKERARYMTYRRNHINWLNTRLCGIDKLMLAYTQTPDKELFMKIRDRMNDVCATSTRLIEINKKLGKENEARHIF